jgi:Tfp pilus assembly protein PilN
MIKINLLPREIYVEDARRQLKAVGVSAAGFVVVLMLGIYLLQLNIKRNEEAKNAELNAELRKYQAIVDQVTELEQTRNLLRARRDVIQQLLVGRLVYPKFFEDFMGLLPSEVWINSMNTIIEGDGVMTVNLNAQSLSNFAIADWLVNLESSPFCSDVKLGGITTQESSDRAPTLSFSMSFRYLRKDV